MSNQKTKAMKIKIGKSKIHDIAISSSSNSLIEDPQTFRFIDKNGLTIAQIKSQKMELDQKRILYFDRIFGDDSSVIYSRFLKEEEEEAKSNKFNVKLILGLSNGDVIVYEKCPSKTLLENYTKIESVTTKSSIYKIYKMAPENLLIVYKSQNSDCYEFANWNISEKSKLGSSETFIPKLVGHFILPNIFQYCVLENSKKLVYIDTYGVIFVLNLECNNFNGENVNLVMKLSKEVQNSKIIMKEIKSSDWLIIFYGEGKISVINHVTEKLIATFTLFHCKKIISVYLDDEKVNESESEKRTCFELFVYGFLDHLNPKKGVFHLRIDPIVENLIQEQQLTDLSKEDFIINLWTNSIFTIISTNLGLKIFDTLSLRCINKKTLPKYLTRNKLVEADSSNSNLNSEMMSRIDRIDNSDNFLIYLGDNTVQIWNFSLNSLSNSNFNNLKQPNSSIDKGLQGNKAIRKYSKYALNSGKSDWEDECKEEAHLNNLRERINIQGLNEEELIAYAQLISQEQTLSIDHREPGYENENETDDDSDFQLALKLSLIEM